MFYDFNYCRSAIVYLIFFKEPKVISGIPDNAVVTETFLKDILGSNDL